MLAIILVTPWWLHRQTMERNKNLCGLRLWVNFKGMGLLCFEFGFCFNKNRNLYIDTDLLCSGSWLLSHGLHRLGNGALAQYVLTGRSQLSSANSSSFSSCVFCFVEIFFYWNSRHNYILTLKWYLCSWWWGFIENNCKSIEEYGDNFTSHTYSYQHMRHLDVIINPTCSFYPTFIDIPQNTCAVYYGAKYNWSRYCA